MTATDEALAANPRSTEVLLAKGEMLRARGDLDGAVNLFEQVIKIDPPRISSFHCKYSPYKNPLMLHSPSKY